jgi:hypothetical protein
MKTFTAFIVVLLLCPGCATDGVAGTDIRLARAKLNAALADRNVQSMALYWHPEVNTIGGDGSLWAGKEKNVAGFEELFKDPNFVSGLRTLESVEVSTGGPKRVGTWEWQERVRGENVTYSGRYLIM